jgi:hypothetical protein
MDEIIPGRDATEARTKIDRTDEQMIPIIQADGVATLII